MVAALEEENRQSGSDINLKELVDRGVKLYRETLPLKKKLEELEQIKAILREEAKGRDHDFFGTGGNIARVEQKADTIARVVPEEDVPRVASLAKENLTDLFTIHPSKGQEKSFELNALKLLTKRAAQSLIDLLTVEATAWVRFS